MDIKEFIAKETERTQKALDDMADDSGRQTPYDTLGDYVVNWIREVNGCVEDVIVGIKMKYNHENEYEWLNVIFSYNDTKEYGIWEYDWWEGQQEVYLVGIIPISEIETFMPDTTGVEENFFLAEGK